MSRTFRKRSQSYEEYYKFWLLDTPRYSFGYPIHKTEDWIKEYLREERYKYKTKSVKYYDFGLPKFYRKMVNKNRRRKDRHEVWKALNFNDYPEQCCKWNCKTSEAWGYW